MRKKLFSQILKNKGQRFTRERDSIFQKIMMLKGHFEPEKLYIEMKKSGMKASRASVYRTVNLLYECGLIEKVGKTEHGTIYESKVNQGHHDHMFCLKCGKVIEFYSEKLERIQDEICKNKNFKGISHSLEIRGYCKECQKKSK